MEKHRKTKSVVMVIGNICLCYYANAANLSETEKTTIQQHLEIYRKQSVSNKKITEKFNTRVLPLRFLKSTMTALEKGRESRIKSSIRQYTGYLSSCISHLKKNKAKILEMQKKYNFLKIDNSNTKKQIEPQHKQKKIRELQKKIVDIDLEIAKSELPYIKIRNKNLSKIDPITYKREFLEILKPCFIMYGSNKQTKYNKMYLRTDNDSSASCSWQTKTKKHYGSVAACSVKVKRMPKDIIYQTTLADKHPITLSNSSGVQPQIGFWVGNIYLRLTVSRYFRKVMLKEYGSIEKLVPALINISKLEKASKNPLLMNYLDVQDVLQDTKDDIEEATGTLRSRRRDLYRQLGRLKGTVHPHVFRRRYVSQSYKASINKNISELKNKCIGLESSIQLYKKLLEALKTPYKERKKAVAELKNIAAQYNKQNINDMIESKREKDLLLNGYDLKKLNDQYQKIANKFARLPHGKDFEHINYMTTEAWVGQPLINYKWCLNLTTSNQGNREFSTFVGFIKYHPQPSPSENHGIIGNKYRIISYQNTSIKIRVGDFIVLLQTAYPYNKLYNKEMLSKAIKVFYDLDAIASSTK